MPKKLTYDQILEYLLNLDVAIISTEYVDNKSPLELNCLKCGDVYTQTLDRIKRGYVHPQCKFSSYKEGIIIKNGKQAIEHKCVQCSNTFYTNRSDSKFCKRVCSHEYHSKKGTWIKNGSKGGKLSTTKFRSKNEICLFNLCKAEWGSENVKSNESMFNGFDADIVLLKHKIAIEWNGKWHYQKVREGHNFEQTCIRDKIKSKSIKSLGYNLIIFKDLKGFNESKVKLCFDKLKNIIHDQILNTLSYNEYIEIDINTREYIILNAGTIH